VSFFEPKVGRQCLFNCCGHALLTISVKFQVFSIRTVSFRDSPTFIQSSCALGTLKITICVIYIYKQTHNSKVMPVHWPIYIYLKLLIQFILMWSRRPTPKPDKEYLILVHIRPQNPHFIQSSNNNVVVQTAT
jgi:hypothetical protein